MEEFKDRFKGLNQIQKVRRDQFALSSSTVAVERNREVRVLDLVSLR